MTENKEKYVTIIVVAICAFVVLISIGFAATAMNLDSILKFY